MKKEIPPKAGLDVVAHRMIVSFLSLIPSVLANRRNKAFIRKEKRKAQIKNVM